MKIIAATIVLMLPSLAACGTDTPERPTQIENDRMNEMDAMLDGLAAADAPAVNADTGQAGGDADTNLVTD